MNRKIRQRKYQYAHYVGGEPVKNLGEFWLYGWNELPIAESDLMEFMENEEIPIDQYTILTMLIVSVQTVDEAIYRMTGRI